MKRYAIGLDVGGTSARVGLVGDDGKLLFRASSRTGVKADRDTLLQRFRLGVRAALRFAGERSLPAAGIGVGMPAFLDEHGCVAGSCNLPGLNGAPVRRVLHEEFRLPVRMENDVSAGTYGEYFFGGHARSSRRMLFFAIGTGIGGGMMVDGKLLRISQGCLGDPGHVIVDGSGQSPCRCGGNGCLEAVASGWALMERARRLGVEATPKEIFDRARAGEARLAQLVDQAATSVGIGLASLCVLLNPDTVVLGGGVAHDAGEPFRRQVEQTIRRHAVPFFSRDLRVVLSQAGPSAGVMGAAALVLFE